MRRRHLIPLVIALVLGVPAAAHAALLYPDLVTLPPRNLQFDRTDVSVDSSGVLHNVLRFSNTVYNTGEGPLEIRATINPNVNPPSGPAIQRVYDSGGGFTDIPLTGSTLYYHAVHKHYHFDNWGAYELWTKVKYDAWVASGETVGTPDLVGEKTTSCVEDEEFVASVAAANWPAGYPPAKCLPDSNNLIAQGLSPGWGDTYDYYRFQQWIDLGANGALANGTYVLRSVSDPQNLVYESPNKADTSREAQQDNAAITTFTVSNGHVLDSDAPSGTVTINHTAKTTTSPIVSLDILGRDDVDAVDQFKVSNDNATFQLFGNTSYDSNPQTISWDLSDPAHGGNSQPGIKTVCVVFHDSAGHWGPVATDTIDYQPPAPPPPVGSAYGKAVQADGPVGWWRLGEGTGTIAGDQMGANPGAYAGAANLGQPSLISADTANTAVGFDGATARVKIPAVATLDAANAFSLEAWVKPASLPVSGAFASVLSKAESYSLQFNGPRLEFTVIQGGTRRRLQAPVGAVAVGNAYHVVGTFDGTTQRLYLNGVQVASAALSGSASVTTNPLYVGSWNGSSEFFKGTIDEPAVYRAVLTAAQVKTHFDASSSATLNAPSGLSGTAASTSQINLSWNDNASGETGQVIERSASSSFSSFASIAVPSGANSYSDTGLSAGTTYWYRVKAVAGATSSPYSNTIEAATLAPATYTGKVLADHPVSYWRLNETSGTIAGDETVASPGTYAGSPTLGVPGLLSTDADLATGFNGTTSNVRVGQAGVLDFTTAMTLEAWIRPSTLPAAGSSRSIIAKPGSYALQLNGPALAFTIVQFGVRRSVQAPVGVIVAGGTYHVVGTFDGTTERLYVNGVQVATAALSGSADLALGGLRIGSWDDGSEFFAGTIDEAAVYSKVLTAVQVADHFGAAKPLLDQPTALAATAVSSTRIDLTWADKSGGETGQVLQRDTSSSFSSPTSVSLAANAQSFSDTGLSAGTTYWYRVKAVTASDSSPWSDPASASTLSSVPYGTVIAADNPVSWWRLDEASGTVAADQRNVNPGAYSATGATLRAASLLPTAPSDTAVAFDGAKGNVRVAQATSLNLTNAFSLEAWVKPASLPVSGAFASVLSKAESYSLQFNGPRLEFTVIQGGTRRRLQAPVGAVAVGNAYHVVGTFDGTTQRLYLNGVQVASAALSGSASVTTNPLYVGSWNGSSEFFKGTIDEPAVYRAVLTATAVARHYAAGTTG